MSDCTERAGSDGSGHDHSLAPRMAHSSGVDGSRRGRKPRRAERQ